MLAAAAMVVAGLATLGTLMGFLARLGWLCELAVHFRLQYAWALLISAGVLCLAQRPAEAALAGGMALANMSLIVPLYAGPTPSGTGRVFRAVLANVLLSNHAHERVRRFIRERQPDFVVIAEATSEWLAALGELASDYPFSKAVVHPGRDGMVLLSRLPLERAEVVRIGMTGRHSILASVQLDGHRLTVIGTHPLSPARPPRMRSRDRQLAELARFARGHEGPLMILGDLNTTSWSPAFRDLLRASRLRDSRRRFGPQPSWPVASPLLRIPLDHCLVSPHVVVRDRRLGPDIGSDHFPVVVDFSLECGRV